MSHSFSSLLEIKVCAFSVSIFNDCAALLKCFDKRHNLRIMDLQMEVGVENWC